MTLITLVGRVPDTTSGHWRDLYPGLETESDTSLISRDAEPGAADRDGEIKHHETNLWPSEARYLLYGKRDGAARRVIFYRREMPSNQARG